jgi:diacylglycerol kinase (ATP)
LISIMSKLLKNIVHSLDGLKAAWQHELSFKLEVIGLVCLSPVPFLITPLTLTQQLLMLLTLITPMIIELINSAIEALCDVVTTEQHEDIKYAKDTASAAVMIAVMAMGFTWVACICSII